MFLIVACYYRIDYNKLKEKITPIPESNKTIDIPKYDSLATFAGYPFVYWHFSKQKEKLLGLVNPETSNDSLVYRIWITHPYGNSNQAHCLIEFRYDSVKWNGTLILMKVDFDDRTLIETIKESKLYSISPLKSSWEQVIESLNKYKFKELPTDDIIPLYNNELIEYNPHTPTFSFEYADRQNYRFYQYGDILRDTTYFWQPRFVVKMQNYLEEEFHLNKLWNEYFNPNKVKR
ncbi:MAG TPA: hypothetical protein PKY56_05030 [Candidatus Kapabacteria bacterium]|nr:hypothetical protein [Candidatus Kapabacteria bacterium]HPO62817.1 hypothetical protein [Candidatus Kapabacteria bacterium]